MRDRMRISEGQLRRMIREEIESAFGDYAIAARGVVTFI